MPVGHLRKARNRVSTESAIELSVAARNLVRCLAGIVSRYFLRRRCPWIVGLRPWLLSLRLLKLHGGKHGALIVERHTKLAAFSRTCFISCVCVRCVFCSALVA